MPLRHAFCFALVALTLATGCSKSAKDSAAEDATEEDVAQKLEIPQADSVAGRWILEFYLPKNAAAYPLAMLEIQQSGGDWQVTMPSFHPNIPGGLTLKEGKTDGENIQCLIANAKATFHFEGRFMDGGIYGNMLHPDGIDPARLIPTKIENMEAVQPRQLTDYETVGKATGDIDPIGEIQSFIKHNQQSPACLIAYDMIFSRCKSRNLSTDEVLALATEYENYAQRWGTRQANMAIFNSAMSLGGQEYKPAAALKLIDRFEEKAVDADMKMAATRAREQLSIVAAVSEIESEDKAKRENAVGILTKLLETSPTNGPVRSALARYERDHGDAEKALKHFATLSVLPAMEKAMMAKAEAENKEVKSPTDELAALWKKTKGSNDGLAAYTRTTYTDFIDGMTSQPVPARGEGEGTRRVLLELFTGAQCAPCVAADLASELLDRTYENTELIVLRYHQHIPAGDPLSGKAMMSRMEYYTAKGTPTLLLNGRVVDGAGGFLPQIGPVQSALRPLIDGILKEASPVRFDAKAIREGDKIQIAVNAKGIKPKVDSRLRLRMALIENGIDYVAPNGIRVHNQIVRAMPGGVNGVSISESTVSFNETISVAELRDLLNEDLDVFCDATSSQLATRPLDLKNLQLVVMVQDDENRRIQQSTIVDVVDGKIAVQPTPEAKADAPAGDAAAEKTDAPAEKTDAAPKADASKSEAPETEKAEKTADAGTDKASKDAAPKDGDAKK